MSKTCYIVAGPNGAGKSTFAQSYLVEEVDCYNFINVDLIAAGISPLRPDVAGLEAGRIFFRIMNDLVSDGQNFSFESTLSGLAYSRRIKNLKREGYRIVIFYLKLPSPDLAVARVAERVLEGGHNVVESDIRRRFERSWINFTSVYQSLADKWIVFDNSGVEPRIIEESL